ncbi:MAG: hypothetical protein JO081_02605 [Alphaproteobacteria bacterium]|nr:hypothetical protein [Alphaproteobacteria bacterium]
MSDTFRNTKIRPAPNGKVYVVWNGKPICEADGGLRYFENEENAHEFLARCDLSEILFGPALH